jgi:drug/metabolite transporter (DMT)-like permease
VRDGVRPRPRLLGFAAVAFAGVALVITRGSADGLSAVGAGELLMLGAVTGWAIYAHGSSRFPDWSPLRYTTLTSVAGTLAIVAATLVADLAGWQRLPGVREVATVAPQLTYLVLIAAVAAVLAMNTGVRRLGPANAALFMNLVPVVTFGVQMARGYRPPVVELAGAALTVGALVAANLTTRQRAAAPATAGPHPDGLRPSGPRPAGPRSARPRRAERPLVVDHLPVSPAALMPARRLCPAAPAD